MQELTLFDLRGRIAATRSQGRTYEARLLSDTYHQRIALAFAALPLVALALAVVVRQPFRAGRRAALGAGAVLLCWTLMGVSSVWARDSDLPFIFLWLPHGGCGRWRPWLRLDRGRLRP